MHMKFLKKRKKYRPRSFSLFFFGVCLDALFNENIQSKAFLKRERERKRNSLDMCAYVIYIKVSLLSLFFPFYEHKSFL